MVSVRVTSRLGGALTSSILLERAAKRPDDRGVSYRGPCWAWTTLNTVDWGMCVYGRHEGARVSAVAV
jgi:hypothetical protein